MKCVSLTALKSWIFNPLNITVATHHPSFSTCYWAKKLFARFVFNMFCCDCSKKWWLALSLLTRTELRPIASYLEKLDWEPIHFPLEYLMIFFFPAKLFAFILETLETLNFSRKMEFLEIFHCSFWELQMFLIAFGSWKLF